jgi:hypothetical protein
MIKTISNNSFITTPFSTKKREDNNFFADDRVILSGLISDSKKEPGSNILQEKDVLKIPDDHLLAQKEVELRCLGNNLSSIEDIHRSLHEYNICGDELQKIHEKMSGLDYRIKYITSEKGV